MYRWNNQRGIGEIAFYYQIVYKCGKSHLQKKAAAHANYQLPPFAQLNPCPFLWPKIVEIEEVIRFVGLDFKIFQLTNLGGIVISYWLTCVKFGRLCTIWVALPSWNAQASRHCMLSTSAMLQQKSLSTRIHSSGVAFAPRCSVHGALE